MFNSYCLVKTIDNTKTGNITDNVFVKGYSHLTKVISPNCGEIINSTLFNPGDIVYFYDYGAIDFGDKLAIKENDVFLCNGKLVKEGIIVKRINLDQNSDGFVFRNQDWFIATRTSCNVPEGCIIVSKANAAFKFNYNVKQYYFITPNNILMVFNNELLPGDSIVLDKSLNPGIFEEKKVLRSQNYYFSYSYGSVVFDNQEYHLIDKKSIYALS